MRLDEGVDIPVNLPLSVSVAAKVISESEQDSLRSAIPPLCISCFPALCTRTLITTSVRPKHVTHRMVWL
ncbi:unnamed protein product [Arctogadus glacialis]